MADTGERAVEVVARAIDPEAWQLATERLVRLGARTEAERAEDVAEVMARPSIVKSIARARASLTALHEAGLAVVPVEPTEAMLMNTVEKNGRPRVLAFTTPEERDKPFLMARYIYRAMLAAAQKKEAL